MKLSAHESRKVLVDRNVAVKFVIQPEPLQGTENDGFPDFQARFQVLGGRDSVTEPDNFDLVRESARFLRQDDYMASQPLVRGTVGATSLSTRSDVPLRSGIPPSGLNLGGWQGNPGRRRR
jgi:hypothetical protein